MSDSKSTTTFEIVNDFAIAQCSDWDKQRRNKLLYLANLQARQGVVIYKIASDTGSQIQLYQCQNNRFIVEAEYLNLTWVRKQTWTTLVMAACGEMNWRRQEYNTKLAGWKLVTNLAVSNDAAVLNLTWFKEGGKIVLEETSTDKLYLYSLAPGDKLFNRFMFSEVRFIRRNKTGDVIFAEAWTFGSSAQVGEGAPRFQIKILIAPLPLQGISMLTPDNIWLETELHPKPLLCEPSIR